MKDHLSQQDVTNYALNELDSRERLYVESLMLGSEELREDACAMIEMARLLGQGFESKSTGLNLSLDESRRARVLAHFPTSFWQGAGRVAAGIAAIAACVAFSVAAPVVWSLAMHSEQHLEPVAVEARKSSGDTVSTAIVTPAAESSFFSFQITSPDDSAPASGFLPTGNVGFMEMPVISLPVDLN